MVDNLGVAVGSDATVRTTNNAGVHTPHHLAEQSGTWITQVLFASATKTNASGTITTGGTAQQLLAANSSRHGWSIQNLSSYNLWFNEMGSTAVQSQPSMMLAPGDYYESPNGGATTTAISIIGSTTGQAFAAREW